MTVMSTTYNPPSGLQLRIVNCRSCGQSTGVPGAAYCDTCRPRRLSDVLMSSADWARENGSTEVLDHPAPM
jgi:hypothetical protein